MDPCTFGRTPTVGLPGHASDPAPPARVPGPLAPPYLLSRPRPPGPATRSTCDVEGLEHDQRAGSGNYSPAREVAQGRFSAMFYTSLGLRQQLMNNRATLALFVTDPLDIYEYRFETRDRTHAQNSRTTMSMRAANLTFTWNFGRPPQQVSRREGPETADETVRIR